MQLLTIDLSTGPFLDERISLPGSFRRFAVVRSDGDLTFRFQSSDDGILLSTRGDRYDLGCDPEGRDVLTGSVRVTGEAGSGTVVIACSVGELPDFKTPAGGNAGIARTVLAHYVPTNLGRFLSATDAVSVTNIIGGTGSASTVGRMLATGASATALVDTEENDGIYGMRFSILTGGGSRSIGISYAQLNSLFTLMAPTTITKRPVDWMMEYADDILFQPGTIDGSSNLHHALRFGIGGVKSADSRQGFVGFQSDSSSGQIFATILSGSSTPADQLIVKTAIAGVNHGELHRLAIRWGYENGDPFVRLLAAGSVVHEFTVPLALPIIAESFSLKDNASVQYFAGNDAGPGAGSMTFLAGAGGILSYSEG